MNKVINWQKINIFKKRKYDTILFKYFNRILIGNKLVIIMMILNTVGVLASTIILFINKTDPNLQFFENNLTIIAIQSLPSILFLSMLTIFLFSKTKTNNVDLFIYIKPYKNTNITLTKQMSIMMFSLHIFISLMLSSVAMLIFGVDVTKVIVYFLAMIFSILISNIAWIFIMSMIAIFLNFIFGVITLISLSFFMIAALTLSIVMSPMQDSASDFNFASNQQNIAKIYNINSNGELKDRAFVLVENPNASNKNKIQTTSLVKNNPINFALSFAPSLMNNVSSKNLSPTEIYFANKKYSVSYQNINKKFFTESNLYNKPFIVPANSKSVFDFNSKIQLYEAIDKEITSLEQIKTKMSEDNYWSILKTELKTRNVWTNTLSQNQIKIISRIIGVDSSDALAYQVFENQILLKNRLTGIYEYFEKKYNKSFANLLKYAWESPTVKNNLYAYKTIVNVDIMEAQHPSLYVYDEFSKANPYDLEYLKKIYFNTSNLNGNFSIKVLDKNGVYVKLIQPKLIFGKEISSKKELEDYIDDNSTINNLLSMSSKIKYTQAFEPFELSFKNNALNTGQFITKFDFVNKSKFNWNVLYVFLFIFGALMAEYLVFKKVSKGDLLLWN